MHACSLLIHSEACDAQETSPSPLMLRQAARSSRLLRLCQAAAALRLAPVRCGRARCWARSDGPGLSGRSHSRSRCATSARRLPSIKQLQPAKPANPPTSALMARTRRSEPTRSLDDDGSRRSATIPSPQAKDRAPSSRILQQKVQIALSPQAKVCTLHIIPILDSMFRLACPVLHPHYSHPGYGSHSSAISAYRGRRMVLH